MPNDEYQKPEYMSFNGLGRTPMIPRLGVPFMVGLALLSVFMITSMVCGLIFGLKGWLIMFLIIPILMFIKRICETDDKAIRILLIEAKWFLMKKLTGNPKLYGGTMTISPISYGMRKKDVERFFKKTIGR